MSKKFVKVKNTKNYNPDKNLFRSIATLIHESKQRVAVAVNSELTLLYWNIGKTIRKEVLKEKRAEYGKQIVQELSSKLTESFGNGWSAKQLRHCLRTAETIYRSYYLKIKTFHAVWNIE